jgi:hypothetical protein
MWPDLIGLQYRWGASPEDGSGYTDCFHLACTVRRRLGLSDYAPHYAWVYEQYTEATLPAKQVLRWVLQHGHRCPPRTGATIVLPTRLGGLATHTGCGIIWLGPGQNVIHTPVPLQGLHSYWLD